jgi:hypothetical protein
MTGFEEIEREQDIVGAVGYKDTLPAFLVINKERYGVVNTIDALQKSICELIYESSLDGFSMDLIY